MNAVEYIKSMDLATINLKLVSKDKYTEEHANKAINHYRAFWLANLEDQENKNVPSELVDDVWHHHILDSAKYFKDCEAVFGKYMHHDPNFFGTPEFDASWHKTLKQVQKNIVKLNLSDIGISESSDKASICGADW